MIGRIHWWQDLTTTDIEALDRDRLVAILPLAAIEQHGPHLPLATDLHINLGILDAAFARLPPQCPALALPPLQTGDSVEHGAFAGTLSLEPATLIRVIGDLGRSLNRAGVRRLLLFNSHGGNSEAAGIAALDLRRRQRMLVVRADYFRFPRPDGILPADELRNGIHGGALETAMMLALQPDTVRPRAIRQGNAGGGHTLGATARAPFAWLAGDLDTTGVVGDPSLASAEQGRRFVDHFADALAELIVETAAFDSARLGSTPADP